jgi:hypothetical protein
MKSEMSASGAIPGKYLAYFQRIRILDSTIFQVPDSFAEYYPGSGGCGQAAGIKIQLEYDLHSGRFLNLQVEPGKNNDKTFGTTATWAIFRWKIWIRWINEAFFMYLV